MIFLPALAPFIATWKALPSARSGRKNSTATRMRKSAEAGASHSFIRPTIESAMPAPAPPNATKSMMVVLASCMTRTFIVILRNSSAFSFILICRAASALKIFNSFSPCTLSRKPSPIEVYLPQYLANIFLAYLDTATMDTGMSGTQAKSTSEVRQSIPTQMANRMSGAIIEKKNCGR